jgi:predicted  nucleic acid-binding Zn-ribbon protein
MSNEELVNAIRLLVREEVTSAVYASEQRTGERLDRIDERLDRMEVRQDRMEARLDGMEVRLDGMEVRLIAIETDVSVLKTDVGQLKSDVSVLKTDVSVLKSDMNEVKGKLDQAILVLDEASYAINDLRQSQHALESKVDDNTRSTKREMQKFGYFIQDLSKEFRDFKEDIQARVSAHEDTPIDQAHPRSAS